MVDESLSSGDDVAGTASEAMLARREGLRRYYAALNLSTTGSTVPNELVIPDERCDSRSVDWKYSEQTPGDVETNADQDFDLDEPSSLDDFSSEQSYHGGDDGETSDSESCMKDFTAVPSPDSDFEIYHVPVDPEQNDKAVDIHLYSASRPHMRAFHLGWTSFFVSFFTWFAITPLLGNVSRTVGLTRKEIWTSSVLAVSSSAVTRVLMGPLCDKYGARWVMCGSHLAAAVPTILAGWLIRDAMSLYMTRLFIGVAGSTFVTTMYWTSCMFTREVAGTANALAAGWGNLAGGVCQIVMGSILFPFFKFVYSGNSVMTKRTTGDGGDDRAAELAWRTILFFPAIASIGMAWVVVRHGDDTPKGNVGTRKGHHLIDQATAFSIFQQAVANHNAWVLGIHYACCFGVEITMTQAAALYFQEEFGQSTASAAAIASVFGWMNLFARGIGGFCSDFANARSGLRGRLWCQVILLISEGSMIVLFAYTHQLATAILVMIVFSIFVQAAEGSTFGIVPYVDASVTGSVTGLVGSGGNVGGICFGLLFRVLSYRTAFTWMGISVVGGALTTMLFLIPGHRGLLMGVESAAIAQHRRKAKLPAFVVILPLSTTAPFSTETTATRVVDVEEYCQQN
jgi:MFS transporter, NNP family, nitrate/nitrite transporter